MIYCEIIQEMDGSTGSPHLFEELDGEFEMERNSDGDDYEMFDLLQLDGVNGAGKLVRAAVACTQDGADGVCELVRAAVACTQDGENGVGDLVGAAVAD